jgi:uncharacterized membrane protein
MPAEHVPHLTVSLGMVLALVCVFAMLLFLHMAAHAIVADEVIRRVAADLEESIAMLPDAGPGALLPMEAQAPDMAATPLPLRAPAEGYIEAIRYAELLRLAQRHEAHVRLHVMAGDFVAHGDFMAAYARSGGADAAFERELSAAVLIGPERTPVQDLAFSMRHLLDVALRALSAAINDDNTALVAIDRLRGALARLLRKELPSGRYVDAQGALRVVGPRHTHEDHVRYAIHAICSSAATRPVVIVTLIEAMRHLMAHARDARMRSVLLQQAELAAEAGHDANTDPAEQSEIAAALARTREAYGLA